MVHVAMTTAGSIGMHRLSALIAKVTLWLNFILIKHRQFIFLLLLQDSGRHEKEANN